MFAIIISLILARQLAIQTEQTVYLIALAALLYLIIKNIRIGIYIIIFLPLIGELIRLPLGPENGLLISDLFIGIVAGVWLIKKILAPQSTDKKILQNKLLKPVVAFTIIALLSLIQAFLFLKPDEVAAGSLYLIRFVEYFFLYLIVSDSCKTQTQRKKILAATITSATLIAIAGFIQLIIYPDLGNLVEQGWDPHINRLVSTWLDPNFIAGFLAFIIAIILGVALYCKNFSHKAGLFFISAILIAALFLTYSRSGYLALATVIIILGILKSPKLIIGSLIICILGIGILPRASQRLDDLSHSISSYLFNTAETPDATAKLRIISWEQTLNLIKSRPILGSGYNTLRYVKFDEGFVSDPKIHSASGSDSSLLTIMATTGILGLGAFCWLYWEILKSAWLDWRKKSAALTTNKNTTEHLHQGLSLGLLAGVCALLIHSFFINSLLFPQILIFLWVIAGIAIF